MMSVNDIMEKRMKKQSAAISVLLVDDEPDLLELATIFLKEENDCFQIDSSISVSDVLAGKTYENYDVIVSDYQMPVMDGLELLAAIRDTGSGIPFIIFTGRGREEVAIRALNLGANHYIQKGGDLKSQFRVLARTITSEVERDRSARLLEESERKYRLVVDNAHEAIAIAQDGLITFFNPRAVELTGYSADELQARPFNDFIHPEDRDFVVQQHVEGRQDDPGGDIPDLYGFRIIHSTGMIKHVEAKVITVNWEGRPAYLSFLRDVTKEKQLERERENHVRFLECMERVNKAISPVERLEEMMFNVEKVVLEVFDCSRAWICYPCDPDIPSYKIPVEVTRPEYPGSFKQDLPMTPEVSEIFKAALTLDTPLTIDPVQFEQQDEIFDQFTIKSQMVIAIRPEIGAPWLFGIHECARFRAWTREEQYLFEEITNRLKDALGSHVYLQALREREERLAGFMDSSTDNFFLYDAELNLVEINKTAMRLFPAVTEKEELLGKNIVDIVPEAKESGRYDRYREVLKTGQPFFMDDLVINHEHQDKHFAVRAFKVGDGLGLSTTDITRSKRMEEEIKRSEARYRSLVETSPDGIVLTDLSGVILMVNQQAARMAGVTVLKELAGRSAFEFFLPEDRSRAMENLNETLALGITRNTRYKLRRKDGMTYWAELSASVIPGADDKPERFMAVIRDISDRKLVEEALKASERNARALLEAIPDLMFLLDKEGRYLAVHGPEELLFTSRESLLGKKLVEVLPEEVGWLGQDKIEQALQSGKKQVFQYELLIGDKIHGFDCRMVPLGEEEVLAIVRDITELTDTTRSLKTLERELTIRNRIANIFLTVQGEEAYGEALDVILEALNSKYGIFGYISITGDLVCPSLTADIWDQCQVPGKSYIFPPESWGGIWGQALREGKTRLSNEPFKVPGGHIAISRALAVPVVFQGQVIGLLMVADKQADYDLPDRELLETIASSFAPVLHARRQKTMEEEERKRAEQALQESERRFRTIFNEANDGLLLADTQTRKFISGNKKICKMLGYELEELEQLGVMDIHPGESLSRVIRQFEKQVKGEIGITRGVPVKRKDDTVFQADISARPIMIDKKTCLLGIFRDVTVQERVKQALQKSEERLTGFMDASTDNFFLYSKDLNLVEINKTALNFFPGMKKQELLGLNIVDIAPDVRESGRYDLYREVMRTGQPAYMDEVVAGPKSEKHHFAVRAFKVGDGLGIATTDITRRVQMEEELRKGEARYRAVVSDQTEFIVRCLPDGTRTFVNDAYCCYFQQSREDLIGSSFFPLVVEEDREIILEKWKTLTPGNPVAVDEHRSILPDGKIAWHQWSDRSIFDQDGNVVEYQSVGRDITDQKLAESALKASEERYRGLFEDSPVSLWDEDFSSVKTYLDILRGSGVKDFNDYFEKNLGEVIKCASKVIVNDINKATLELYGAKTKEEILENLQVVFTQESYDAFKQEIINITGGNYRFKLEAVNRTLTGKKITVELRWSVIPGHENDLSRVLVSITDISERKAYQEHLEELVEKRTADLQELTRQLDQQLADLQQKDEALHSR